MEEAEPAAVAADARVAVPMTFGGLSPGLRGDSQTVVIAPPAAPSVDVTDGAIATAATGGAAAADEAAAAPAATAASAVLAVADGAAGVIAWQMALTHSALEDNLGVDSRRAVRLALPDGCSALCIALRPPRPNAPPVLACGCERGGVVLLTLDAPATTSSSTTNTNTSSSITTTTNTTSSSSSSSSPLPAPQPVSVTASRVIRLADGPAAARTSVLQLTWSADGAWLYAASACSVCCVPVP